MAGPLMKAHEELRDSEILSSGHDIDVFLSGTIWRDLEYHLEAWLADTHKDLEFARSDDPSVATVEQLQGRARAIREMLQLPHELLSLLEARNDS